MSHRPRRPSPTGDLVLTLASTWMGVYLLVIAGLAS